MQVPIEWSDIETGTLIFKGKKEGVFLAASSDLANFYSTRSQAGVFIGVSRSLARTYNKDGLLGLEKRDLPRQCVHKGRFDHKNQFYSGQYDHFTNCPGMPGLLLFTTASADNKSLILIRIAIVTKSDLQAADTILNTFQVLGDPERDEHHDDEDGPDDPGRGEKAEPDEACHRGQRQLRAPAPEHGVGDVAPIELADGMAYARPDGERKVSFQELAAENARRNDLLVTLLVVAALVFDVLDDCTRLRVIKIYEQLTQKTAIQFVDYVLSRLPFQAQVIQTDNGKEFGSQFHWHLLDRGIRHVSLARSTRSADVRADLAAAREFVGICRALRPDIGGDIDSLEVTARRPDGGTDILLYARDVSATWPTPFILKKPLLVRRGTQLSFVARSKDPSRDVRARMVVARY